jgi:hypothetical protein
MKRATDAQTRAALAYVWARLDGAAADLDAANPWHSTAEAVVKLASGRDADAQARAVQAAFHGGRSGRDGHNPGDGKAQSDGAEDPRFLSSPTLRVGVGDEKENVPSLPLPFRTASEISREGIPPTEWLAPGLLPAGGVVLLSGAAKGAGKTTFLVHAVRALLTGGRFLSERCERAPVVYLTEQAEGQFFPEYLEPAGVAGAEDLHLLTAWEAAGTPWFDLVPAVAAHAVSVGARVVIVDTFMRWAGLDGESENAAATIQKHLAPLSNAAAEHGLCFVVVHHDRKAGGDVYSAARGSSAFQGAVDLIANLQRPPGGHGPNARQLETAGRYADALGSPEPLMIELDTEGGTGYRALGTGSDVRRRTAEEAAVMEAPGTEDAAVTLDALHDRAREAGVKSSRRTFRRAVDTAVERRILKRRRLGGKGNPWGYWAPPDDG